MLIFFSSVSGVSLVHPEVGDFIPTAVQAASIRNLACPAPRLRGARVQHEPFVFEGCNERRHTQLTSAVNVYNLQASGMPSHLISVESFCYERETENGNISQISWYGDGSEKLISMSTHVIYRFCSF